MKSEPSSNSGFLNYVSSMNSPPFYCIVQSELYGITRTAIGAKELTKNLYLIFEACVKGMLRGERPHSLTQGIFFAGLANSAMKCGEGIKHLLPLLALMSVRSYLKK